MDEGRVADAEGSRVEDAAAERVDAGVMPGRPTTTLSDTTASERVRVPAFRMPPPRKRPCPRVMVKSSMLAAAPLLMLKTRLASLPLTASRPAPGPSIRRPSVMPNSPLVRATVPRSPWAKVMTSAPGLALAAVIAARSEPGPLSARLPTVKVLRTMRSSSCATLNRVGRNRFGSRVGRCPCSVPDGTKKERPDRSQDDKRMAKTPWEDWSAIEWRDIVPGADRAPGLRCHARACSSTRSGLAGRFASTGHQSEPGISPPDGVRPAHQAAPLIPGDSVRTLPSARPTRMPPG